MELDLSQERKQAHAYLDQLSATQLSAVRSLLASMVDPVAHAITYAPADNEPFAEEDRQAVAEADDWLQHNQPILLETVLEDFGLTMSDWEKWAKRQNPESVAKRIVFTGQAQADIRSIEQRTALQILKTLARFLNSGEGDVKRVQDVEPPLLRLRTQSHRVFFRDLDDTIEILRVRDRKQAYR